MQKENNLRKGQRPISFLCVELVAVLAFNLANISFVFAFVGVLLAIFGIFYLLSSTKNKKELIVLISPIVLLFCLSSIASFNDFSRMYGQLSFENISLFLSLPAFFILGFLVRKFNNFKPMSVLICIGVGLALLTLAGLIATLVNYGFFHSALFKDTPIYYQNGTAFDITKEMFWLRGFSFSETSVTYGSLFAVLCASYLPGLLFICPKKNRNEFISTLFIGAVGLITLVIIPNLVAILILVISSIGALLYKFVKNNKIVTKIAKISLLCIICLGVLFFLLSLLNVKLGYKFNGFLDRLFVSNRIMNSCTLVMEKILEKGSGGLFGLKPFIANKSIVELDSGVFEVQLLKECGIIGTFVFLAFAFEMLYFLIKYVEKSSDSDQSKAIILTFVFAFFIYNTFQNTIIKFTHDFKLEMFLRSPLLLIIIFFFGYTYLAYEKEETK